jgi:hypothetical protein
MSILPEVLQYIANNLKGRQLLTFRYTSPSGGTGVPVGCLFFADATHNSWSPIKGILLDTPSAVLTSNAAADTMLVYNPTTKYIETLDSMNALFSMSYPNTQTGIMVFIEPMSAIGPNDSSAQFYFANGSLYQNKYGNQNLFLNSYVTNIGSSAFLGFCTVPYQGSLPICSSSPNISLLKAEGLVSWIQYTATLCCTSVASDIVNAILNNTDFKIFQSLQACQAADAVCACPTNNSCWMFNNTNVPCCIQGNPTDPRFAVAKPVVVTQDYNTCQAQAVNCSQWRFNTVDVPCCIQRSPAQWLQSNYSNTGLQSFNTKADCDAAAATAGTCNFQNLLTPPSNVGNYYDVILESKFTSGCNMLRTAGPWGSSSSCDSDPDPMACYAGNCTKNYCAPWQAGSNAFTFNQQVRCLPSETTCCTSSGKKQVITNPGQPNVTSTCQ